MDMWSALKRSHKPVLLYGMGDGADKILSVAKNKGVTISGVFVSDDFLRDKTFHGFKLLSYSQAKDLYGDFTVLLAFGTMRPEVIANIKRISGEQCLLVPDVPVAGDTLFDIDFAKANADKLLFVYNKLETELDKYIFESIIRYKLTGRAEYLFRSAQPKSDAYKRLALSDGSVCVDCGAYNGDTLSELFAYCDNSFAYAIEPDVKSFAKLKLAYGSFDNVTLINAAVNADGKDVAFSTKGSRGSKSVACGTAVPAVVLDTLLADKHIDYIKFDVEGMESEALNGAKEIISKQKPKLFVSCYHKSEDIFDLPLKVLSIREDYKLHIFPPFYLPAWDCAYIFV